MKAVVVNPESTGVEIIQSKRTVQQVKPCESECCGIYTLTARCTW